MAKRDFNENLLLHFFHTGEGMDEEDVRGHIEAACWFIDSRQDCADFVLVSLLRILFVHRQQLEDHLYKRIRLTLIGFKYWMDEPGEDSMCYWSENHQILFASAEYLAGQLWPDAVFENNGMTGSERRKQARRRILDWLELRWRYGFAEWYSNVYYIEDIGPLCNLIDFAEDDEIVRKCTIILDLLFYDIASQSWKGHMMTNSGRLYEGHKKSGHGSSLRDITADLFGYPPTGEPRRLGMDLNFLYSVTYKVPEVLCEIGRDEGCREIRSSNGLDISELRSENLLGQENPKIMMQWGMEAFTNPEVFANSLSFIRRNNMLGNEFLKDFSRVDHPILRRPPVLKFISRALNLPSNGIAIQRSNSYMYRCGDYSLSTSQDYHPGSYGDQQHIWEATLAPDLSVFTTHPACLPDSRGSGGSPSYWVGSGHLPHSVQNQNINLTLYRLPWRSGLKTLLEFTHAWFPENRFDEVLLEGCRVFGRKGDALIAITAGGQLNFKHGDAREDLIQEGRDTWWITEMSTRSREGDFEDFVKRIKKNFAEFNPRAAGGRGCLSYTSREKQLELEFGGEFRVDGEKVLLEYFRADSPYASAPRKPQEIKFDWAGKSLVLHFDKMIREEQ